MSDKSQWDNSWRDVNRTIGCNSQWEYMDKTKLEYLGKLLPAQGITLEVGCGSARISAWLAQKGFRCCCLDNSKEAIRVAQANFEYIGESGELILADALRLPFEDNSFVKKALLALQRVGQNPKIDYWPGGTDGSMTAGLMNIPTIGYSGMQFDLAHTPEEMISIEMMMRSLEGYFSIIGELFGIKNNALDDPL